MENTLTLTYYDHACFSVTYCGYTLLLDPYKDGTVPGLPPLRVAADRVLCSHDHDDHNFVGAATLSGHTPPLDLLVKAVDSVHDDAGGAKRGRNTIHLLDAGGLRLVHLGDQGAPLTPDQLAALLPVDIALVPVGGYYTVDAPVADLIARQLGARIVIPMHYRTATSGFDVLSSVDAFAALRADVVCAESNTAVLEKDSPAQTLILRYL